MPTSNFQPVRLLDADCCYKFTLANSADPDQLASESWLLQKPADLDLHYRGRVCLGSAGQGFRKHTLSNILKISLSKTESFQIKILIFFSSPNIDWFHVTRRVTSEYM